MRASTAPTPSSTLLKKIPFDAKAVWLNAEHIRALPVEELSRDLEPFFEQAGFHPTPEKVLAVTPLIRERIKLLRDAVSAADFFFLDQLAPYDPAELIPVKKENRRAMPRLRGASCKPREQVLATTRSITIRWTQALRAAAAQLGSEGRADVSADPRRRLRTQERAAAL